VIKLFLDIHKPGAPRNGGARADYLTSGLHIDAFAVNGAAQQYGDGTAETLHQTPDIWAANPKRATVTIATRKTLQSLSLDGGIFMDAGAGNDRWSAR
jgi:hypothetical protein